MRARHVHNRTSGVASHRSTLARKIPAKTEQIHENIVHDTKTTQVTGTHGYKYLQPQFVLFASHKYLQATSQAKQNPKKPTLPPVSSTPAAAAAITTQSTPSPPHPVPMAADAAAAAMSATSLCDDLEPATVRTRIRDVLAAGAARAGDRVVVGGWVRTGREQGKGSFAFLELSDGSCAATLQAIVDAAVHPLARLTATGTSVLVEGVIKEPPEGTKQNVELKVSRVLEVGEVDAAVYPLPKGKVKLTLEKLRDVVHLRSRTNTVRPFPFSFLHLLDLFSLIYTCQLMDAQILQL
jgi:hypothetical protein